MRILSISAIPPGFLMARRPPAEIIAFGEQILSFLLRFDVKVVVAACNTSSSVSLPVLRQKYHLPVLGVVEPGVRAALQVTSNRRIGVLATAATVNSGAYTRCLQAYEPGVTVFAQACPQFVPLVEAGKIDGPEVRAAARQYLQPLREAGVDTIVLGCTHYPFLAPVIRELAGEAVEVVDPAVETVKELAALLAFPENAADRDGRTGHRFFASGATALFLLFRQEVFGQFPISGRAGSPGSCAGSHRIVTCRSGIPYNIAEISYFPFKRCISNVLKEVWKCP